MFAIGHVIELKMLPMRLILGQIAESVKPGAFDLVQMDVIIHANGFAILTLVRIVLN